MKNCIIRAIEIAERNGVTTITLPADSLANLCECQLLEIGLFTSIPNETLCTSIEVTDGTVELEVYCKNQLWRPERLKCRSVLTLQYKSDPELLVFVGGANAK